VDGAWHLHFTKLTTLSGLILQILLNALNQLRYATNSTFLIEQQAAQCWNFSHKYEIYPSFVQYKMR